MASWAAQRKGIASCLKEQQECKGGTLETSVAMESANCPTSVMHKDSRIQQLE